MGQMCKTIDSSFKKKLHCLYKTKLEFVISMFQMRVGYTVENMYCTLIFHVKIIQFAKNAL